MCCSINSKSGEQKRQDGLIAGHAYTVIDIFEVDDVKLLKIRNPWGGSVEWNGKWSDKSPLWEQNPKIKEEAAFIEADDGIFFMENHDFQKIFEEVGVLEVNMIKKINTLNSTLRSSKKLRSVVSIEDNKEKLRNN